MAALLHFALNVVSLQKFPDLLSFILLPHIQYCPVDVRKHSKYLSDYIGLSGWVLAP